MIYKGKNATFLKRLSEIQYEKTLPNSQSNLTSKGCVKKGKV